MTGLILWRVSWLPGFLKSATVSNNAVFLHQLLTYASIGLVAGHIYLAAVAKATRPALSTIIDGTVPIAYARDHPKWAAGDRAAGTGITGSAKYGRSSGNRCEGALSR